MHMKITTVELAGMELAHCTRAAVGAGFYPPRIRIRDVQFNSMKITMKIAMKISPENWKTNLG